jgi:hypothetical protein
MPRSEGIERKRLALVLLQVALFTAVCIGLVWVVSFYVDPSFEATLIIVGVLFFVSLWTMPRNLRKARATAPDPERFDAAIYGSGLYGFMMWFSAIAGPSLIIWGIVELLT